MTSITDVVIVLLVSSGLCFLPIRNLAAADKAPSEEELKRITEAMPTKTVAVPSKPVPKLLVFSLSWGYKHSSIPYGKKTVEIMAAKTKAFELVISDDLTNFEPQNIGKFGAIFFLNTNNEIFLPEDLSGLSSEEKARAIEYDKLLKKSLTDYLASGGGLAVLHSGIATFRKWPEYSNIIGVGFDNHPWYSGSTVTLKVDEPNHRLAQAFKGPNFVVADETYQCKAPYSRDNLRVLLSIDTEKTNMNVEGIHRKDNDFAISWVKSYGEGRVFCFLLGHDHDLFWNPTFLQHLLDGLQFALGDLKADTTPSNKVKKPKD